MHPKGERSPLDEGRAAIRSSWVSSVVCLVWVLGQRGLVDLDAPTRLVRDVQVAIFGNPWFSDELAASVLIVRNELQYRKVVCSGGEVDVDGRGDRSHRVVRRDHDIVTFRDCGDLSHLHQSAADADVGVDLAKYVIALAIGAVKSFDVGDVHSRQPSRKLC